nr:carbon storage regulator [Pseudomonas syringae]
MLLLTRREGENIMIGDAIQFMHRNFKMPMHQADAWKEASCLHSDA